MCSLQQHNNAAPGENEKMKEKAKKAAVLLTSVQKCDLIYTERFGIVKTAGARTKQLQIANDILRQCYAFDGRRRFL